MIFSNCASTTEAKLAYRLDDANRKLKLPKELNEISGLAYTQNSLFAVQDEDGILYKINHANGLVEQQLNFGPKGDYEGVAAISDHIYVTNSEGKIYQFNLKTQQAVRFKTGIDHGYNIEGICADDNGKALFLIGKTTIQKGDKKKHHRHIFKFDLQTKTVTQHLTLKPKKKKLHPSGIAIHPQKGHFYILSHASKSLFVVSPQGEILSHHELSRNKFEQPEGIVFLPNGTLVISSEGKKQHAQISFFEPKAH